MKALLKRLTTVEEDHLDGLESKLPRDFSIALTAWLGPDDANGEEMFGLEVCTPGFRGREIDPQKLPIMGRGRMLVERFDPEVIAATIRHLIADLNGDSWHDLGTQLSRYFYWEFDGYTEVHR